MRVWLLLTLIWAGFKNAEVLYILARSQRVESP